MMTVISVANNKGKHNNGLSANVSVTAYNAHITKNNTFFSFISRFKHNLVYIIKNITVLIIP